jgi:hypothetical protein
MYVACSVIGLCGTRFEYNFSVEIKMAFAVTSVT